MSFISLQCMGIRSLDIMADSANAKQMLLTLNSKLGWMALCSPVFSLNTLEYPVSQKLHDRQQQGSRMIRFVKMTIFWEFNGSFSYVRRPPAADSVIKIRMIRLSAFALSTTSGQYRGVSSQQSVASSQ